MIPIARRILCIRVTIRMQAVRVMPHKPAAIATVSKRLYDMVSQYHSVSFTRSWIHRSSLLACVTAILYSDSSSRINSAAPGWATHTRSACAASSSLFVIGKLYQKAFAWTACRNCALDGVFGRLDEKGCIRARLVARFDAGRQLCCIHRRADNVQVLLVVLLAIARFTEHIAAPHWRLVTVPYPARHHTVFYGVKFAGIKVFASITGVRHG